MSRPGLRDRRINRAPESRDESRLCRLPAGAALTARGLGFKWLTEAVLGGARLNTVACMAAPLKSRSECSGPSPSAFEIIDQVLKMGSYGQFEYARSSRNTSTPVTDTYIQIGNVQRATFR